MQIWRSRIISSLIYSNIFYFLGYTSWRGAHILCWFWPQQERRFMCLGVMSAFDEGRINGDLDAAKSSGLILLLLPNLCLPSPASHYFLLPKPIQLQKNTHSCNTAYPPLQPFHMITLPFAGAVLPVLAYSTRGWIKCHSFCLPREIYVII